MYRNGRSLMSLLPSSLSAITCSSPYTAVKYTSQKSVRHRPGLPRLCLLWRCQYTTGFQDGSETSKNPVPSLLSEENKLLLQMKTLKHQIEDQDSTIQSLKEPSLYKTALKTEYAKLKALNKKLEAVKARLKAADGIDRERMLQVASRLLFFNPSFDMYGGLTGLYDLGPLGTGLLNSLVREWERQFVRRDSMMQVACPVITPEAVLRASGHVDKFADYVVKDTVTQESFRLDHLVKSYLEALTNKEKGSVADKEEIKSLLKQIDGLNEKELEDLIQKYNIKSPSTGNALTSPTEFNLMFPVAGEEKGGRLYLRPETAQGIFLNFPRLLMYNKGLLPFAAAQVGLAFRNEISPQSKLLRMRQFTLAEIEHFCYPDNKTHHKFHEVSSEVVTLLSGEALVKCREAVDVTIEEAVRIGLVANETLGYYMARIQQYLLSIGIKRKKLRFRQHLSNEMAHYACDCWDAECLTSYGWIECVGCADRSAYDLSCHAKASGVRLTANRVLSSPQTVDVLAIVPDKQEIGRIYNAKKSKKVIEYLISLTDKEVTDFMKKMERLPECDYIEIPMLETSNDEKIFVSRNMISGTRREKRTLSVEKVVPNVIEPSFGMDRIMYSVLEHCFTVRESKKDSGQSNVYSSGDRSFFALPARVAPVAAAVLCMSERHTDVAAPILQHIVKALQSFDLTVEHDRGSGSIGRRYTHCDQRSIPYVITVDFITITAVGLCSSDNQQQVIGEIATEDTIDASTVTLRDRDTMEQVRLPVSCVSEAVYKLIKGDLQWQHALEKWPKYSHERNTNSQSKENKGL